MQHNVYMRISSHGNPQLVHMFMLVQVKCVSCRFTICIMCPHPHQNTPQTKTVILQCSFGTSVTITTGTVVLPLFFFFLFCLFFWLVHEKTWYLMKGYVPDQASVALNTACCSLCERNLFYQYWILVTLVT